MMIEQKELQRLAEAGLAEATGLEAEVKLENSQYELTRFAEGQVHQNLSMDGMYVTATVFDGRKRGEISLSAPNEERVREAVRRAVEQLRYAEEGPERPIPTPEQGYVPGNGLVGFDEDVIHDGTTWRTYGAQQAVAVVESLGPRAFGRLATEVNERITTNTQGLVSYTPRTRCTLSLTTIRDDGYGYAQRNGYAIADIDVEEAAREAAGRCNAARNPQPVPAGEYAVILLPYATADIVSFLGHLGADGQAILEGRSFMSDRIGKQVFSDKISLWDDGFDPRGCPIPFDGEGVLKERVELVNNGVVQGGVYSQQSGAASGRPSTGHAPVQRPFDTFSSGATAVPQNLFMAPGVDLVEDMIRDTRRGLLVSTFHYTRVVEPREVVITGMTRNGTFLVENGELVGPVKNLRFTDSYIRALNQVTHVGAQTMNLGEDVGNIVVPAVRLESLRFTGTTEF